MSSSNSTTSSVETSTPSASSSTSLPLTSSTTSESSTSTSETSTSSSSTTSTTSTTSSSSSFSTPTTTSTSSSTSYSFSSTSSFSSSTSSAPPTTSETSSAPLTTEASTSTNPHSTVIVYTTLSTPVSSSPTSSSTSSTVSSAPGLQQTSVKSSGGGGLSGGGTIAVAVVVPIVAVALILLAGLFLWRKRKARKDAEELRRKEVEEYGYNPNNDPTLPAVGGGAHDGPFEMREENSTGYRGWGTTAVASSGRKPSTTLSGPSSGGGGIGMAYSDPASPTHGTMSDTRSDNQLMDNSPGSGEEEPLGAMGPAVSGNRNGDINRGPSNASSSYSAANRSDNSGDVAAGGAYYANQYDAGNPYTDTPYGSPPGRAEMSGQPVIRDVQARRNTRIENPAHFPQQSAGISQNF